jgi:hypothetical protein
MSLLVLSFYLVGCQCEHAPFVDAVDTGLWREGSQELPADTQALP